MGTKTMVSLTAAGLIVVISNANTVMTAPARKSPDTGYFPTKVGTVWKYERNGVEWSEEIKQSESKDGAVYLSIESERRDYIVKVSDRGLFKLSAEPMADNENPAHLLKLPHKDGQKWVTRLGVWGNAPSRLIARGPEEVEVPAGKFRTIRVETTIPHRYKPEGTKVCFWYAPGVGLVKSTHGSDNETKLKSFSEGKDR
jgi:hypothetical protein